MTNNKWAVEELESNMEGYTQEERKQYLEDVTHHGCVSGAVSGVIYYYDTETIFKNNMQSILEQVADYEEETGFNPLTNIIEAGNTHILYNYLVWFIVEQEAQRMLQEIEDVA